MMAENLQLKFKMKRLVLLDGVLLFTLTFVAAVASRSRRSQHQVLIWFMFLLLTTQKSKQLQWQLSLPTWTLLLWHKTPRLTWRKIYSMWVHQKKVICLKNRIRLNAQILQADKVSQEIVRKVKISQTHLVDWVLSLTKAYIQTSRLNWQWVSRHKCPTKNWVLVLPLKLPISLVVGPIRILIHHLVWRSQLSLVNKMVIATPNLKSQSLRRKKSWDQRMLHLKRKISLDRLSLLVPLNLWRRWTRKNKEPRRPFLKGMLWIALDLRTAWDKFALILSFNPGLRVSSSFWSSWVLYCLLLRVPLMIQMDKSQWFWLTLIMLSQAYSP